MHLARKNIHLILAPYIGQKIILDNTRFSEDQEDREFTLSGVTKTQFQVEETGSWYDFEFDYKYNPADILILKPLYSISDEDLIEVVNLTYRQNTLKKIYRDADDEFKFMYKFISETKNKYPIGESFSLENNCFVYRDGYQTHDGEFVVAGLKVYQYLQMKGYDIPNYFLCNETLEENKFATYNKKNKNE